MKRKVTSAEVYAHMLPEEVAACKAYNRKQEKREERSEFERKSRVKFRLIRERLRNGGAGIGPQLRPGRKVKDPVQSRRKTICRQKRSTAKKVGRSFNLSVEQIDWAEHCPCCGVLLDYAGGSGHNPDGANIDRIDSSRGYELDNVQILCRRCNYHKSDMTPEEAKRLSDFMNK